MKGSSKNPYIVKGWYDWLFLLLSPTYALLLGILISGRDIADKSFEWMGEEFTATGLFIGVFIHAHLSAVFFRSHVNPNILRLHPVRFLIVPVLLWLAMVSTDWILVSCSVLATFWDVYHSGLQTFGFSRIYDSKRGNDPSVGRRLDWWLNHFLYAGPILGGAVMMDHFEDFNEFELVEDIYFTKVPAFMEGNAQYFTWAVVAAGSLFLLYYLFAYLRLYKRGYQVSWLKVFLLVNTGICSIYSWGFNSWGEAFFIMNFFHALQYFALVWAMEHKHIIKILRFQGLGVVKKPMAWLVFIGLTFGYGVFVQLLDTDVRGLWAITLVVSLMHFWYDGFIWSVKRKQV